MGWVGKRSTGSWDDAGGQADGLSGHCGLTGSLGLLPAAGSQYAAWNSTSTLLAATCDTLRSVLVFEPVSGHMVMRVEGHPKPVLW